MLNKNEDDGKYGEKMLSELIRAKRAVYVWTGIATAPNEQIQTWRYLIVTKNWVGWLGWSGSPLVSQQFQFADPEVYTSTAVYSEYTIVHPVYLLDSCNLL